MHRTRHDPNHAATQHGAGRPGPVLDLVVLTQDAGLLATLREAAGPEHAIWHAESADAAVDLLVGGRCSVLVADLGTLRGDASGLLDRLHAQFPELVLMATGRRQEESAVAALVSDGRLYRFLHKPVSPARAGNFITAATRRYHELRNAEPPMLTTVKTIASRPRVMRLAVAGLLVLLGLIAALIWMLRPNVMPAALEAPAISERTAQEQIADLLARAQIAHLSNRLAEPRGDNALEYFRAVLALQPGHAEAKAGIEQTLAALEARVVRAIESRDAAKGAAALMTLQRAAPDHPRLDALRSDLLTLSRSARPPVASPNPAAPARAPAVQDAPEQAELNEPVVDEGTAPDISEDVNVPDAQALAEIAALRERGALLGRDEAYDRLMTLSARHPDAQEILSERQRLAFALLERARTAVAAKDLDDAATFLDSVERLVPGMNTTRSLQEQLAAARGERDFQDDVVPAASLERVRDAAPVYPRAARNAEVEGWVDVVFTVAADGTTQHLQVREASPRGTFDEAALEAVRRWRFAPVMKNGAPAAQRSEVRIRFELR